MAFPDRSASRGVPCMMIVAWLACTLMAPAQDSIGSDFSSKPAIEKRLAEAETEVRDLPADADPELREQLEHLGVLCQAHRSALEFATAAAKEREAAAAELSSWNGFAESPPYPVTRLDVMREKLAELDERSESAKIRIRILERVSETAGDRMDTHQQAQRQLEDALNSPGEDGVRAARDLAREKLASRISAEEVARANRRLDGERALLAANESRRQLAELQVKTAAPDTRFSQEELDGILAAISSARSKVSKPASGTAKQGHLDNTLTSWELEFLDTETEFWKLRFAAYGSTDAKATKDALSRLRILKARVDDWVKLGSLERLADENRHVMDIDPEALRKGLDRAVSLSRRMGFAMDDLGGSAGSGTPVLDLVRDRLLSVWNAELYLVEDTSFIDGKQVTTYRAVTLGKVIRLLAILVIGWLLLRMLSRRLAKLISRREGIAPATGQLIARWFLIAGFVVLLVYGMNAVHIPFTAFAFLGGALAIGVGFGAQTLLKNFISGLILIFERPIKVGDQVEVDGTTGRIRSIGMRASVIQHYDGIDTLIPNSLLLENKLTNWTFSDSVLRQTLSVGVAYGSPAREVARLLAAVAREHGLVLDDPAPEVRLDGFGDNALNFTLLFWFDSRKARRATLASDLRFMIEKSFSEAGVVIAFPQKDVHFDPSTPLRIEFVRGRSDPNPGSDASPVLP